MTAEFYRIKWKQENRIETEYFEDRIEFRDALFHLAVAHLATEVNLYRLAPWHVRFLWRWMDIAWHRDSKKAQRGIVLLKASRLVDNEWREVSWKVTPPALTWSVAGQEVVWSHEDPLGSGDVRSGR